jgi:hypothetical protein
MFQKTYEGYSMCIKEKKNDNKCCDNDDFVYKYKVYIPEIKLFTYMITEKIIKDYEINKYKLFFFNNEETLKKKIRVQLSL